VRGGCWDVVARAAVGGVGESNPHMHPSPTRLRRVGLPGALSGAPQTLAITSMMVNRGRILASRDARATALCTEFSQS
jgi:hypothetical protein